jgi:hypothetical protein
LSPEGAAVCLSDCTPAPAIPGPARARARTACAPGRPASSPRSSGRPGLAARSRTRSDDRRSCAPRVHDESGMPSRSAHRSELGCTVSPLLKEEGLSSTALHHVFNGLQTTQFQADFVLRSAIARGADAPSAFGRKPSIERCRPASLHPQLSVRLRQDPSPRSERAHVGGGSGVHGC